MCRYNEFHSLQEKLKKNFPDIGLKLPPKRILGNNFDPEFIKNRREGLHDFVMNLVKVHWGNTVAIHTLHDNVQTCTHTHTHTQHVHMYTCTHTHKHMSTHNT